MTAQNVPVVNGNSRAEGINRREFLHYLLGASLGLVTLESCGFAFWYTLPRARWGVDLIQVDSKVLPKARIPPVPIREGGFWLSYTDGGLVALYMVCVHDTRYYKWVPANSRFECPQCGSKFTVAGECVDGPAPRDLDRFRIQVITPYGRRETSRMGEPVSIEDVTSIIVDTRYLIQRKRTERCGFQQFDSGAIWYPDCPVTSTPSPTEPK